MNQKLKQAIQDGNIIAAEEAEKTHQIFLRQKEEYHRMQVKYEKEVNELKEWVEQDIYPKITRAIGNDQVGISYGNNKENSIPSHFTYKQLVLAINKIEGLSATYNFTPEDREGPAIESVYVNWKADVCNE